jgi:hypothetical protein
MRSIPVGGTGNLREMAETAKEQMAETRKLDAAIEATYKAGITSFNICYPSFPAHHKQMRYGFHLLNRDA